MCRVRTRYQGETELVTLKTSARVVAWLALATAGGLPPLAGSQTVQVTDTARLGPLTPLLRRASPLVAARRAQLDAAQARAHAAGFALPLALAAEVEEVPDGIAVGRAGSARLELSREITPGLGTARRALAQIDVDRAQLELELAERLVVARAVHHLAEATGATAIAARLASEDSLLVGAEQVLQTRFAVGDARYVDVLRLRTERLRVQSERAAVLTEARAARGRLLALVAPPDTVLAGATALVDSLVGARLDLARLLTPPPPLDVLLAGSGTTRRAALAIDRAQRARRLGRVERRPSLVASLGVQRFETGTGHTLGPTIGASMTLPFTSRANAAADAAAARAIVAARATGRAALAHLQANAAAARDQYETVRARLALYDAALLRGARDERESALASYRSGALSLLELLDFERALARAEIDRLRTHIEAAEAIANLVAELTEGGEIPMEDAQ